MYSVCIYIAKSGLSVLSMSMMVSKKVLMGGGWVWVDGWVGGWVGGLIPIQIFIFILQGPLVKHVNKQHVEVGQTNSQPRM